VSTVVINFIGGVLITQSGQIYSTSTASFPLQSAVFLESYFDTFYD